MRKSERAQHPTLRQLELLLALVSSDGIAGAGAKLGMTPSATSHALRALEDALGVQLVERNQSGLSLTYAGEQVLPHVRDVFASLQLVTATARAGAELKTGLIRVGSFGASASLHALPALLEQFRTRYPGVSVVVTERPDEETSQDLIERRIELAAVTLPKPDFETITLAVDELVAVLPAGHELAALPEVQLADITRFPFIMTRAGSQKLIQRLFARHGCRPTIAHELLQIMSILEYVSRREGVSILARLAVPESYPGVRYVPLQPRTRRSIGLACLGENKLSPAARALWQEAKRFSVAKY
ncbi:LysR family transcriptional regulator [Cupriavidus taiwanensis]|uniref:LysR family transcriptional regulator n=1 Tax=Cupriavidus taiwanensis TaxID=164546 RepID=UPI0039C06FF6